MENEPIPRFDADDIVFEMLSNRTLHLLHELIFPKKKPNTASDHLIKSNETAVKCDDAIAMLVKHFADNWCNMQIYEPNVLPKQFGKIDLHATDIEPFMNVGYQISLPFEAVSCTSFGENNEVKLMQNIDGQRNISYLFTNEMWLKICAAMISGLKKWFQISSRRIAADNNSMVSLLPLSADRNAEDNGFEVKKFKNYTYLDRILYFVSSIRLF